jgi:SagB-type dehydrogenase family enzyme
MSENLFTDRDPLSISELYHTNTKLNRWNAREYGQRVELFGSWQRGLSTVFHPTGKVYAWAPSTRLATLPNESFGLGQLVTARRSARSFHGESIDAAQLAFILQYSAGVTDAATLLRAYPSAGAMYPLELYVIVLSVHGHEPGLYHYSVHESSLSKIGAGDYRDRLSEALFAEDLVRASSAVIVLSAVFHRSQIKYGERGYRMTLMEAGHLAQNMLLAATAQQVASVPIGGFIDDDLNEILGLDGIEESALYPLLLGK